MSLYEDVESALTAKFITLTGVEFTEDACTSDIDSLIGEIGPKESVKNGVLYVFGGGARPVGEPFQGPSNRGRIFKWRLGFIFFIKYFGDSVQIEKDVRNLVDEFKALIDGDPRLGDIVPYAEIIAIDGPPEEVMINDFPFVTFTATLEFWDKS